MALNNRADTAPIYLTVIAGKLTQKVKKGTENAVERVNKKNETVYELLFDSVSGRLTNIEIRENEYEGKKVKSWEFTIRDVVDVYRLQTPFSGRVPNGILMRLPNIDLGSDIEVRTHFIDEKTYTTVHQFGQKIVAAFTKDNPNGLPPLEKVTFKGQEVWDDTKQMLFLQSMVFNDVVPKLNLINAAKPASASNAVVDPLPETEPPFVSDTASDDLPF